MTWRNWLLTIAGAALLAGCASYPPEYSNGYYDRYGYYHSTGSPRYYSRDDAYVRGDREEHHWWHHDDD